MRKITVRDGVLWENGHIVPCEEADVIAQANVFVYAEHFVKRYNGLIVCLDERNRVIGQMRKQR
jgi:hypothetical protein